MKTTAKRPAEVTPTRGAALQRACGCGSRTTGGECDACRKKRLAPLQRSATGPVVEVPLIVHDVLQSPGQPLDAATRAFMEPRFGRDFSGVRVHTDARAEASAREIQALAYAVGTDIVFAKSQFKPSSTEGRRLLAHELAHTVQQAGAKTDLRPLSVDMNQSSAAEREATETADRIMSGARIDNRADTRFGSLQRQSDDDYHGIGGWLHKEIYEPLQRAYSGWITTGINLADDWNDQVPVLGYVGGTIVGLIPVAAGTVGKAAVGAAQLLTPKTQEDVFLMYTTFDLGVVVNHVGPELRYGWWWLANKFRKKPEVAEKVINLGPKVLNEVVENVERRAPTVLKGIPTKGSPGNRVRSVEGAARVARGGPRGPSELLPTQNEWIEGLIREHSQSPLHPDVAARAVNDAVGIAGKGVKGADILLRDGRVREITVFHGNFRLENIRTRLIKKSLQATEVFMQINSPDASRAALRKWAQQRVSEGDLDLAGTTVRFFGPDGSEWWFGTIGPPK